MRKRSKSTTKLRCLHCDTFLRVFSLDLSKSSSLSSLLPLQNLLSILIHLQFDDDNVGRVNSYKDGGTVGLFSLDPFNVDNILLPVTLDNLSNLLSLVVSPNNLNFIILPDGHRSYTVFSSQLLGKRCRHDLPSDVRWSVEVFPPGYPAGRGNQFVHLCHGWRLMVTGGDYRPKSPTITRPERGKHVEM